MDGNNANWSEVDIFDSNDLNEIDFNGIGELSHIAEPFVIAGGETSTASVTPSLEMKVLRTANTKYARFQNCLGTAPSVGNSVTTTPSNETEQWTPQDAVNFREYKRKQGRGEFKVHKDSLPPSEDEDVLKEASAKHSRFRRAHGKVSGIVINVGDKVNTPSRGTEVWSRQDAVNYKAYSNRKRKGDQSTLGPFAPNTDIKRSKAATDITLALDNSAFLFPKNSNQKNDVTNMTTGPTNTASHSKKPKM